MIKANMNDEGSIGLWFSPEKPEGVDAKNWL